MHPLGSQYKIRRGRGWEEMKRVEGRQGEGGREGRGERRIRSNQG